MQAAGTSRLVVISAAPVASDDHDTTLPDRLLARPLLRRLLGGLYADMATMEEAVRRSRADWTILRPPWLSDGPRTGTWRQAKDANLGGGARISRADLAEAIPASLQGPGHGQGDHRRRLLNPGTGRPPSLDPALHQGNPPRLGDGTVRHDAGSDSSVPAGWLSIGPTGHTRTAR